MKFSRGLLTGGILGAVAGMMILPNLSKGTRNQINKTSNMIMDKTTGLMNEMKIK